MAWSALLQAGPAPTLGQPPTAPTPADAAKLPRRGIAKHGPSAAFTVNTVSREAVRNFFNTVFAASRGLTPDWTGDLAACNPGSTDAVYRDRVALRINFFRAVAGVPADISFSDANNAKDQQTALMMAANGTLSHTPPPSWSCYTADGAQGAANSNIALGNAGPDAITAYMEDFGVNNTAVGHRRWLLYPQTQVMGTGDLPETAGNSSANATWVIDGNLYGTRPSTRDNFVSWPPPGYLPYQLVFARWSISYPNANFSSATVTLASNGVDVAVAPEPLQENVGEETLVWYPIGLDPSTPYVWPRPVADTVYSVSVRNVVINGSARDFNYTVTVFDPQVPGADTVLPVISGPDQPAVSQGNDYTFAAVTNATGYHWRLTGRAAFAAVEGAENGLASFTSSTAADYNVIVTSPKASGSYAFQLAHTQPDDQILSYNRLLAPGTNSQMQFKSRLGYATTSEVAKVQISQDGGHFWQDVYSQAGAGEGSSGEASFTTRIVPLNSFAHRSMLVRFNFHFTGEGSYYNVAQPGVGWSIDDISFSNTEELTNPVIASVPSGTRFTFTPAQAGDYALEVRAQLYGAYDLEWGPIKQVAAVVGTAPVLQFSGSPSLSGGQVQIDFEVTNYRAGMTFQLFTSADLPGAWTPAGAATFQTLLANSKFRVTTSTGGAGRGFYRLQAN